MIEHRLAYTIEYYGDVDEDWDTLIQDILDTHARSKDIVQIDLIPPDESPHLDVKIHLAEITTWYPIEMEPLFAFPRLSVFPQWRIEPETIKEMTRAMEDAEAYMKKLADDEED